MSTELSPQERLPEIREQVAREGGVATRTAKKVLAGTITISLSNSGGKIALNWSNTGAVGDYDYVALFDKNPTDPDGYLTRQWTYVDKDKTGTYKTGTDATGTEGPAYWIAYIAYDYATENYLILETAGPSRP
jgi:hypothetical protein